ncbi:MAG TPA: DivIVA domain-containing protein [Streptosporangiaceae bacterium]|nr:DivIVA domain-containing protein [Streptosporangiaceae bacterium]
MAAIRWHPQNPFPLVMRGYDPRSVDEFLIQLARDGGVEVPVFQRVMRGYDPRYVDERIQQIKQEATFI